MFCFDPWDLMSGISDLKKSSWIWILLQKEWRMNSCAFEGGELKKKKMYTLISTPLENMNTLMNRYGHSSCLVPHLSDLVDGFTVTRLQNQCWSGSYIQTLFLMGSPCYAVYFSCMKKAGQLSWFGRSFTQQQRTGIFEYFEKEARWFKTRYFLFFSVGNWLRMEWIWVSKDAEPIGWHNLPSRVL